VVFDGGGEKRGEVGHGSVRMGRSRIG
jgi:hypothetical protein